MKRKSISILISAVAILIIVVMIGGQFFLNRSISSIFARESGFFRDLCSGRILESVDPSLESRGSGHLRGTALELCRISNQYTIRSEENNLDRTRERFSGAIEESIISSGGRIIDSGGTTSISMQSGWEVGMSDEDIRQILTRTPFITSGWFAVYQIGLARGFVNIRIVKLNGIGESVRESRLFLEGFEVH